jgi:hypothetical protein
MKTLLLAAALLAPPALAADAPADPSVTRISYWTTRSGKGDAASAFWKQFAPVFEQMKAKGLLNEWFFVTPEVHSGEEWDLAYIWRCRDWAAYGEADQYFSDAVGKMDGAKIERDFDAAFDGSKHRDEVWESTGFDLPRPADAAPPGVYRVHTFKARPGQHDAIEAFWQATEAGDREMQRSGLIEETLNARPSLHAGQEWDSIAIWGLKDMTALGAAERAFRRSMMLPGVNMLHMGELFDMSKHRDFIWKRVDIK